MYGSVTEWLMVIATFLGLQLVAMAKLVRDVAAMKPKVEAMWNRYQDVRTDGGPRGGGCDEMEDYDA